MSEPVIDQVELLDEIARSRGNTIQEMRDVLDFLESNPAIPLPYLNQCDAFGEKEDLDEIARAMAPCKKTHDGSHFSLRRQFGAIRLGVHFDDVCERIVTGSKEVPEKVIEAHTEDIVEWKCPDGVLRQA